MGPEFYKKAYGCLVGGAVGDAMGAPVEGWTPAKIQETYGVLGEITGDGRFTDDTYISHLLCRTYIERRHHLCAHAWADMWKSRMDEKRIWLAELYGWYKTKIGNCDPRTAGYGNIVNCGAAMYIAPVGIINACRPGRAYLEAIEISSVNQWSFGKEAAGVLAAGVAEAFRPAATVDSVCDAALELAKDGTRECLAAVCSEATSFRESLDSQEAQSSVPVAVEAVPVLRRVMEQFDTTSAGADAYHPSRTRSIEEVPIAFGLFAIAGGDPWQSIVGGVNYGRDADSIAGMAGSLAGALRGGDAIPKEAIGKVEKATETDLGELALQMTETARDIITRDTHHLAEAESLFRSP
jgi:ADP-ribosylglycohydrolase